MKTSPVAFPLKVATIRKNAEEQVRVSIEDFHGFILADVRIYSAFTAAKVPMATKRGVSIQIGMLPDLVEALQAAELMARALGLIPPSVADEV
jgi:hypothetical protein